MTFTRIDTGATPGRFVTRIFADRANPNVAIVSYSGFNALTPATPGHVFRAEFDPSTGRATFTSSDFDLGDIPINTLAYDHVRGHLYAATDFGPLVLKAGTSRWVLAGRGFPEVVMVDLEINAEHALVKKLEGSTHFDDLAQVLFDQAVLAEGGHLEDPAAYVARVTKLLSA